MASLACRGARDAKSAAAASSSGGSGGSYNGGDARHYLRWWKVTRNLYSEATREIVRLQAALTAAEGEASTARAMLSTADGRVVGTVLLFEHN